MDLYLSQYLGVEPTVLRQYGAFDISVVSDLPLFIDPFLLFNSAKDEYQALHKQIVKYIRFLRDKALDDQLDQALIKNLYMFGEVKQNWLGFTVLGNGGHGLGLDFARSLHGSLRTTLQDFGDESISRGSHLEKVGLFRGKVGRDTISDFTTTLIKEYLLEYTQTFATTHLRSEQSREFGIERVCFNYETEVWEPRHYTLPVLWGDFVLLTPVDILTRDDTWISPGDLVHRFHEIPPALPNDELRAQVSSYFYRQLPDKPKKDDRLRAIQQTISQYPELIDYYIRLKEDEGDKAEAVSKDRVTDTESVFVQQLQKVVDDLRAKTSFYQEGFSSYEEALRRVKGFKHYIEHQDGYKLINRQGQPFAKETEVHLFFGLIWFGSIFDVNREVDNGRGPVDFKVSIGAADKSLIEFKLASNTHLKRNLERQVEIYEQANNTRRSIKVIVFYTDRDQLRAERIVRELKVQGREWLIMIDARSDNKPSASQA